MANPAIRPRFLSPGDKLGKFELIRQIAVGRTAELYLARTMGIEGFEKLVVVKRILPQFATDPTFVTMFLSEARLSATLHHPNIAQAYDIGAEDGDYFFSMEYVHGEDLGHLHAAAVAEGVPMSFDASLTLVAGLCAGLHYVHEKAGADGRPLGVVHRDVSPSNILVSYDGGVKLVDFGLARPTDATYMSPEQCRGTGALDRRSDIYAIGTVMFEVTTGRLPFAGEASAVVDQIVHEDAPSPTAFVPDYPPALAAIVSKALARDPKNRYATALEMQGEIEDFAHEHRLRVSPLVLARLMSTLFPARLEEWDQARAQGAFFVEQHVVRTLAENGKSAGSDNPFDADDESATVPEQEPPPVVLVAPPPPPMAEVRERVRVPARREETEYVGHRRSAGRGMIITAIVTALAVAAAAAYYVLVVRAHSTPTPELAAKPVITPEVVTPTPSPPVEAETPRPTAVVPPDVPLPSLTQLPAPEDPKPTKTFGRKTGKKIVAPKKKSSSRKTGKTDPDAPLLRTRP